MKVQVVFLWIVTPCICVVKDTIVSEDLATSLFVSPCRRK